MKRIINVIISVFLASIFLSFFCLVYDYIGPYVKNPTNATDYVFDSRQYIANMSEGFAWIKMDENGFNNGYEIKKDKVDILLMGSSHMEARQVVSSQNVGYILNEKLPDLYTYNIGISGKNIYLNTNKYLDAISYYKPKYSIMETGNIALDIEEMNKVINHTIKDEQKYNSSISYYLKKIPVVKTIFNQMKNWIDYDKNNKIVVTMSNIDNDNYKNILYDFLNIISSNAKTYNVVPIIFYHPSEKLTINGTIDYDTNDEKLNIFKDTCNQLDIVFVDTTPYFIDLYATKYKLGHGFINTKVGAGHLNKYGHEACAEALVDILMKLEGDKK